MNPAKLTFLIGLAIFWLPPATQAKPSPVAATQSVKKQPSASEICSEISARAADNGIPESFFARLIWKESLFDPSAVSPKGAEGIAQFMPGTAELRGLADPFDPKLALAASATYLSDLRQSFGNLGLAAAAYNAGEERIRRWIAGTSELPLETQDYVLSITGRSHDEWKAAKEEFPIPALDASGDFSTRCASLALRKSSPPQDFGRGRAKWKRWGVILSAGFSESKALTVFHKIKGRHASLLKNEEPLVLRKKDLSRGRRKIVRVMIGRDSRAEAESLCLQLTSEGAACLVERN